MQGAFKTKGSLTHLCARTCASPSPLHTRATLRLLYVVLPIVVAQWFLSFSAMTLLCSFLECSELLSRELLLCCLTFLQ